MRRVAAIVIASTLFGLPLRVGSADGLADPTLAGAPNPESLPSIGFASTIAGEEIYEALKSTAIFTTLDKEKPGSPVTIRVSHIYGHMSTATSIASAILVGGTLGLLPAFTNRDLVITYEVIVNGSVLTTHAYSKNLSRVFNVHATDKTHGLGADGLAWVTGTSNQFAADIARDPKYAQLIAEYHFYYDVPANSAH